jgi:glucan biosynthesis protein
VGLRGVEQARDGRRDDEANEHRAEEKVQGHAKASQNVQLVGLAPAISSFSLGTTSNTMKRRYHRQVHQQ